jgi:hypothetical protein
VRFDAHQVEEGLRYPEQLRLSPFQRQAEGPSWNLIPPPQAAIAVRLEMDISQLPGVMAILPAHQRQAVEKLSEMVTNGDESRKFRRLEVVKPTLLQ